jgi:hypothetical protein
LKKNYITYKGIIHFDPVNKTKKHESQADWKRMALVMFDGEIAEYYSWFLKKRYNLILNKPIRGAHISFINDSIRDICKGLNCSETEAIQAWEELRERWDGKEIEIVLDLEIKGNGTHYWLIIPQEEREELHSIRSEIGLGRPYYGLHMSIGYANEKNIKHSEYVSNLMKETN